MKRTKPIERIHLIPSCSIVQRNKRKFLQNYVVYKIGTIYVCLVIEDRSRVITSAQINFLRVDAKNKKINICNNKLI